MLQRILATACITFATLAVPCAQAAWPDRPLRVIVPFPAGGTTDVLVRPVLMELSNVLRQPVVIDNRPGAGSNLGAEIAAKAPADGYTLFVGSVHNAIAMSVYKNLKYSLDQSFDTIAVHAMVPHVLLVSQSIKAESVADLVSLAKAKPGALSYASGGTGTSHHIIGEMFKQAAEVDMLHVPYKGGPPATADLMAGQVDVMFETSASALAAMRSGRVKALAVTTDKRSPALPDLPTLVEAGIPGFDARTWYAIMVPRGTPDEISARLSTELLKIFAKPEVVATMEKQAAVSTNMTPAQAQEFVRSEIAKWAAVVKRANVAQ